jgi:hypothetical protein
VADPNLKVTDTLERSAQLAEIHSERQRTKGRLNSCAHP